MAYNGLSGGKASANRINASKAAAKASGRGQSRSFSDAELLMFW